MKSPRRFPGARWQLLEERMTHYPKMSILRVILPPTNATCILGNHVPFSKEFYRLFLQTNFLRDIKMLTYYVFVFNQIYSRCLGMHGLECCNNLQCF